MEYPLIGNHPSIVKIRELISMVSDMAFNVLLLGETGTGKEVVARLLHKTSSRQKQRFIKVNCAALPLTLLESELFGYEKGAFTGADKLKLGKFELASDGVIFLDEIGDMPLILQAKLLQVLQGGEFNRLGGTKEIKVNAWVIASTNHDLEKDIKNGLFREDLFYRLNIIKVEMPPLRERKGDIPLLAEYFIKKNINDMKIEGGFSFPSELNNVFRGYHWPGNVRELSSALLRLMVGDEPAQIRSEMLNAMKVDGISAPMESVSLSSASSGMESETLWKSNSRESLKDLKKDASDFIEKKAIKYTLDMTGWNKSETARKLGISYKALFYKMENLGIEKQR